MAIYKPPIENNGEGGINASSPPTTINGPQDKAAVHQSFRTSHQSRMSSMSSMVEGNPYFQMFNKLRIICGDIVNHPKIQVIIIALIIINAIMMGIGTFNFVTDNPTVESAFEKTDMAFLIVFTIELVMQFIFRGYTLFMDGWLVFDFVIIVVSWSLDSFQIIRAFRIFRALRIITRIETMRNLVAALFDIMPRLGAITALLVLIFYIFAVLFTQLFGELTLENGDFSRLHHSLLTLFVMMTMEWADLARECMAELPWAWAPFIAFIMITGFIVFNLIIAVVCDAVAVIENKEDLEPDFFAGVLGGKDLEEENGGLGMKNEMSYEEELVENLAGRIQTVLKSQKEMLATLEALTKDSLIPTQQPTARRVRISPGGEESGNMSDDS